MIDTVFAELKRRGVIGRRDAVRGRVGNTATLITPVLLWLNPILYTAIPLSKSSARKSSNRRELHEFTLIE